MKRGDLYALAKGAVSMVMAIGTIARLAGDLSRGTTDWV